MNNANEMAADEVLYYTYFCCGDSNRTRVLVEGATVEEVKEKAATRSLIKQKLTVYRVGDQMCEHIAYIQI